MSYTNFPNMVIIEHLWDELHVSSDDVILNILTVYLLFLTHKQLNWLWYNQSIENNNDRRTEKHHCTCECEANNFEPTWLWYQWIRRKHILIIDEKSSIFISDCQSQAYRCLTATLQPNERRTIRTKHNSSRRIESCLLLLDFSRITEQSRLWRIILTNSRDIALCLLKIFNYLNLVSNLNFL